jgi:hypothetical protein
MPISIADETDYAASFRVGRVSNQFSRPGNDCSFSLSNSLKPYDTTRPPPSSTSPVLLPRPTANAWKIRWLVGGIICSPALARTAPNQGAAVRVVIKAQVQKRFADL